MMTTPILRSRWVIGLGVLALIAFLTPAANAEESGPGTEFRECRNQAWADYNECLVESTSRWGRAMCDVAWDLDNIGCDVELMKDLTIK